MNTVSGGGTRVCAGTGILRVVRMVVTDMTYRSETILKKIPWGVSLSIQPCIKISTGFMESLPIDHEVHMETQRIKDSPGGKGAQW